MILCFQTDAAHLINLMINHDDIRGTIQGGTEWLDATDLLLDSRNVCLAGTGGAALFMWQAPGVYKGHIWLLRGARGVGGFAFGQTALAVMFGQHGAVRIVAAVPLQLPAARVYVRRLGFLSSGVSPNGLDELFELEKQS